MNEYQLTPTRTKPIWRQSCCLVPVSMVGFVVLLFVGYVTYGAIQNFFIQLDRPDRYAMLPGDTYYAWFISHMSLQDTFDSDRYIQRVLMTANLDLEDVKHLGLTTRFDASNMGSLLFIYTDHVDKAVTYWREQGIDAESLHGETVYPVQLPQQQQFKPAPARWLIVRDDLLVLADTNAMDQFIQVYHGDLPNVMEARPEVRPILNIFRDDQDVEIRFMPPDIVDAAETMEPWVTSMIPATGMVTGMRAMVYSRHFIEDGCRTVAGIQMTNAGAASMMVTFFRTLNFLGLFYEPLPTTPRHLAVERQGAVFLSEWEWDTGPMCNDATFF